MLGRLAEGESILVQGGTSGVGMATIQIAKLLRNARVFATAGTEAKRQICRDLGAEIALDYKSDWVQALLEATENRGIDVILDAQAGPYTDRELQLLAFDGRLVLIASHLGERADINVRQIVRRRLTLTGSTIRPRPPEYKGRIAQALVQEVWPLLEDGRMRLGLFATFALADVAKAHAVLDANEQIGKLVLIADSCPSRFGAEWKVDTLLKKILQGWCAVIGCAGLFVVPVMAAKILHLNLERNDDRPVPGGGLRRHHCARGGPGIVLKNWGVSFVIENRGRCRLEHSGAAAVAKASTRMLATILFTDFPAPVSLNKLMYRSMPYDPETAFEPVVLVAKSPLIIAAKAGGFSDLKEMIAFAKANPARASMSDIQALGRLDISRPNWLQRDDGASASPISPIVDPRR